MSKRWTQADIDRLQGKAAPETGKKYSGSRPKNIPAPRVGANALTQHALRVLDLKGFKVWRQNNGGVYDPTKKVFRAGSSTPGISDILGFHRRTGIIIACEIKAGKDRLSEQQEAFLESVRNAGGIALVIRTTDDIEKLTTLSI